MYMYFVTTYSRKVVPVKEDIISTVIPEDEEMEVTKQPSHVLERWLKFNDTLVEEFVFTDSLLEAECFGGAIKTTSSDPCMLN